MAIYILKKSGRALEIGANFGCAAVSANPKAAFPTIQGVINFH